MAGTSGESAGEVRDDVYEEEFEVEKILQEREVRWGNGESAQPSPNDWLRLRNTSSDPNTLPPTRPPSLPPSLPLIHPHSLASSLLSIPVPSPPCPSPSLSLPPNPPRRPSAKRISRSPQLFAPNIWCSGWGMMTPRGSQPRTCAAARSSATTSPPQPLFLPPTHLIPHPPSTGAPLGGGGQGEGRFLPCLRPAHPPPTRVWNRAPVRELRRGERREVYCAAREVRRGLRG